MVWSVWLQVLALKTTLWLVEILAFIQWYLKLTIATKRITPYERVWKTVPENGVISCVPFCLRSLGRWDVTAYFDFRKFQNLELFALALQTLQTLDLAYFDLILSKYLQIDFGKAIPKVVFNGTGSFMVNWILPTEKVEFLSTVLLCCASAINIQSWPFASTLQGIDEKIWKTRGNLVMKLISQQFIPDLEFVRAPHQFFSKNWLCTDT